MNPLGDAVLTAELIREQPVHAVQYQHPLYTQYPPTDCCRQHLSMLLSSFTDCRGDEDPVPSHLWRDTGLWNKSISSVRMLVQYTVNPDVFAPKILTEFLSHHAFEFVVFFFFLQLQIHYDKQLGNLIVHVLQARNLVQRDNNGYSDPFVKVYLLPGRGWVKGVETAHTHLAWKFQDRNRPVSVGWMIHTVEIFWLSPFSSRRIMCIQSDCCHSFHLFQPLLEKDVWVLHLCRYSARRAQT